METNNMDENENLDGKIIVNMLGEIDCLPLPDGWIGVNHYSGGIIYLHKKTRVVTWSRPYSIGCVSLKKHDIPTVAIPCLHQMLSWLKYKSGCSNSGEPESPPLKKSRIMFDTDQDFKCLISNDGENLDFSTSQAGFKNVDCIGADNLRGAEFPDHTSNSHETKINEYMSSMDNCEQGEIGNKKDLSYHGLHGVESPIKTTEIQNIELIKPYQFSKYLRSIYSLRNITEEEAHGPIFGERSKEEPRVELPDVIKALPCIAIRKGDEKEHFAHKPGNTHLSMLNEYCKKNFKKPPGWMDCASNGHHFIVDAVIDGVKYGRGEAKSKKAAKQLAAKHTLEVLMPEEIAKISEFLLSGKELEVFDKLNIDNPRVTEFTKIVGLPLPSDVLSTCLKRNRALCDTNIQFKLIPSETNDKHTYEIVCGKHSATGFCKNRKIGKQLAAQAILKKIHPKLEKWGQLILLYCSNPTSVIKEAKETITDNEYQKLPESKKDLMIQLKKEMRELEVNSKQIHLQKTSSTKQPTWEEIHTQYLDL